MRFLYENMLLPRNVERRQRVSRYYRIKVLPNVAEKFFSKSYSAKAQLGGVFSMFAGALTYSGGFFEFNLKGDDIMDGDASHKHIDLIDKSEVDNGN